MRDTHTRPSTMAVLCLPEGISFPTFVLPITLADSAPGALHQPLLTVGQTLAALISRAPQTEEGRQFPQEFSNSDPLGGLVSTGCGTWPSWRQWKRASGRSLKDLGELGLEKRRHGRMDAGCPMFHGFSVMSVGTLWAAHCHS